MGLETKPLSSLHAKSSYDPADFEVPTGREEEWRFTPLSRLKGLHDGTAAASGNVLVTVDAAPEAVVETAGRGDARIGAAYVPADRVSAQAYASFEKATVVTFPREAVASEPTVITFTGSGEGAAFGHTVVVLEPMAEAVVVLEHTGSAVYADNVEFVVGDGATLKVVSLQDWADDAVHVSHHHARLGRDATFRSFAVTLGGDLVRLSPSVAYTAPGGDADLTGLYFADAGQHLEHRLLVDHSQPNCKSNVVYKGALQGEGAHAVWIGDVIIRVEAEGTDTYELNRNLLLTDGARADSVPNLEILTGEVAGAGHASASGRLDDEHIFYLQARGIPFDEARRLVIRGFFAQLLEKIELPELRERVFARVEAELER
ncbi:Fe-S cluster assembly protein SufD [Planomonospora parontospora subsp. parontospora]|uniref:Fe-S cluster assembly protein SufD n=2 Tax=Planomonospora parontospora TaxID=58119 RepID=A0AA37F499_9ACTN|nr:Fe-S cluster assembly protein SufD [Planomonospora parontospora]GGK66197.1 Fe-S cluster assembly protein SufD [Planomonospora parontospora]GII08450.1 Fe-S cluster assembly protein SufD [Planomonospora parontospora subsp. parontospora]